MIELREETLVFLRDNITLFREGIAKVVHRCKCDFVPEDVYREITAGNVFLLWAFHEGESVPCGFTVLSRYTDRYSKKEILSADITYLVGNDDLEGMAEAVYRIAQELNVSRVEWYSPRPGWKKVMGHIGYAPDATLYSREVTHG